MKNFLFTSAFLILGCLSIPSFGSESLNINEDFVNSCTYVTGSVTTTASTCAAARAAHIAKLKKR